MIWIILAVVLVAIALYITRPFGRTIASSQDMDDLLEHILEDYHPEEDDDKDETEMG